MAIEQSRLDNDMDRVLFAKRIAALIARWLVGGIFIFAAITKMRDILAFSDNIAAFEVIPNWLVNTVAITVPFLELCAAFCIVSGIFRGPALLLLACMLVVFEILLIQALIRGIVLDCGCFGNGSPSVKAMYLSVIRNIGLGLIVLFLYRGDLKKRFRRYVQKN